MILHDNGKLNQQRLRPWRRLLRAVLGASILTMAAAGCGGGSGGGPSAPTGLNIPITLNLATYNDPWPAANQRYWDIDDRPLSNFISSGFTYNSSQLTVTYDAAPDAPYFVGRVQVRGLKPNFCYQVKLAGKPVDGPRGWKAYGDDTTNARIGAIGRWWCDSDQANVDDSHFATYYTGRPSATRHSIYGYQLMGIFVTDENGNADVAVNGSGSFHVTWQDKQNQFKHFDAGTFSIGTTPPYYGYGHSVPTKDIKLWLERESGRPTSVRLPAGRYNCRIIITEESFHNNFGGTSDVNGGFWKTVLANEDFTGALPDSNAANDIVFTIK